MHRLAVLTLLLHFALSPCLAQDVVEPTIVTVRAVSHDAKIIGSNVGGARIVIQDAETGAVLAEGIQEGNTGSTELIMVNPPPRGETRYATDGAAGFVAELPLTQPTFVDITAFGPDPVVRSTKRVLLVPGKHVLGEGILVELNGFTVDVLEPSDNLVSIDSTLTVRASVTMICGCPTEPDGLWDANDIEVVANLRDGGRIVAETTLAFAGIQSTYEGILELPRNGLYELMVFASDPGKGNFGLATRPISTGL